MSSTATTEIYTLSLHDALPISEDMVAIGRMTAHVVGLPGKSGDPGPVTAVGVYQGIRACLAHVFGDDRLEGRRDRKSTRLNSSHVKISYAVFCLKKKIAKDIDR